MPLRRQFAAVLSAMVQTVRASNYLQHHSVTCRAFDIGVLIVCLLMCLSCKVSTWCGLGLCRVLRA